MMNRRDWLTKTSLALAGGLVLGDAVMEQYERLTHKKVFALGAMNDDTAYVLSFTHNGLVLPPGHYRMSAPLGMRRGATVLGSSFVYPGTYDGYFFNTSDDGMVGECTFHCTSRDLTHLNIRLVSIGSAQPCRDFVQYRQLEDWRA